MSIRRFSFWNLKLAGKYKATQKSNPIKDRWMEPSKRRQKGKATKKGQKMHSPHEPRKRERASPSFVVGGNLTHGPFNVTLHTNREI
jgi:hypothetical protein